MLLLLSTSCHTSVTLKPTLFSQLYEVVLLFADTSHHVIVGHLTPPGLRAQAASAEVAEHCDQGSSDQRRCVVTGQTQPRVSVSSPEPDQMLQWT